MRVTSREGQEEVEEEEGVDVRGGDFLRARPLMTGRMRVEKLRGETEKGRELKEARERERVATKRTGGGKSDALGGRWRGWE